MLIFGRKGPSGFSACSTAEEVTEGINGTGLTAIITGSSNGIGTQTARIFALRGIHVIMGVRNIEAGKKVKQTILKENAEAKIEVMELDLSSLTSVRKFAREYKSLGYPLNLLINNAGMMVTPYSLSTDNIELHFATNHLGPFLLTNLLLEVMKSTARESCIEGRIVNISSEGYRLFATKEGIRFDKINEKSSYGPLYAYGQSKLANILHANELTKRFKEEGMNITANSVHPGTVRTNAFHNHGFITRLIAHIVGYVVKTVQQGAATTCYVALHPHVKGVSGEYFADSNVAKTTSFGKDEKLAKELWDFSLSLTESK